MTAPDIDSFDTYGGHKENYAAVEDPTTDRSALDVNAALCTVAAMSHTGCRAWARMTCGASPTLAVTNSNDGMWPNILGNKPAIVHNGVGDYTLTWPTTVQDEDGNIHTVNFRAAEVHREGVSPGFHTATVVASSAIRVRMWDTGASASDVGVTVLVKAL